MDNDWLYQRIPTYFYGRLLRTDKMFIQSRVFQFISKTDVSEKCLCSKIFQSTADLYNLLHIVNESVDIVYDKRLFLKEVIRDVNYEEVKKLA